MKITFSIIIPVYNVRDHLDQCIQSILLQSYSSFEVILIDDGSTDGSKERCRYWSSLDPRIALYCQKNSGPNVARNSGIEKRKGQYTVFVDADDWISPNTLQVLHKYCTQGRFDIINFGYVFFDADLGKGFASTSLEYQTLDGNDVVFEAILGKKMAGVCWNKCYRSELFQDKDLRFVADKMHARDILFTRQVALKASRAAIIPDILYHSRFRHNSFSRSFGTSNIYSALDLAKKHKDFFSFACDGALQNAVAYSIGKHLRYILVLSSFRSPSYSMFLSHHKLVKESIYWQYILPIQKRRTFFNLKDYLLSALVQVPQITWLFALIARRLSFQPY